MNSTKTIQTQRLILRPLLETDVEEIFVLRSNPEIGKYIQREPYKGIAEAYTFIKKIDKLVANNETYYWAIQLKDNIDCVGTICLWNFSEDRKTAEVGYDLLLDFQGVGIMSEALVSVLNFGFNTLNLFSIEAFTHKYNETSKKLLQKNGFALDAEREDPGFPNNIIFSKNIQK